MNTQTKNNIISITSCYNPVERIDSFFDLVKELGIKTSAVESCCGGCALPFGGEEPEKALWIWHDEEETEETCGNCYGDGYFGEELEETCSECYGEGYTTEELPEKEIYLYRQGQKLDMLYLNHSGIKKDDWEKIAKIAKEQGLILELPENEDKCAIIK